MAVGQVAVRWSEHAPGCWWTGTFGGRVPVTESLLERAMDRLLQERTGIIIAHRLQTIHRADDIMILEHGRVVEYGSRASLALDPASRFYSLLQTGLEEVLV